MRHSWPVGLSVSLLCACGSAPPAAPAPTPTASVAPPAPAPAIAEPEMEPAPTSASGARFGQNALAPFAEELVSVVQAAFARRPLPAVSFPIERHGPEDELVRSDGPVPAGLDYIALALQLEVALDGDGIELMLFVSRHGVKLMGVEQRGGLRAATAPRWLPVGALVGEIVADLRADRLDRWWVGAPERELLGPALARELDKERSEPDEIAEAKRVVSKSARVTGISIDDVTLVARDAGGAIYGLRMQFESGDRPELDSHPLVRIKAAPDD